MFKLVVLSALVAVSMAAPAPGGVLAYSSPVVAHSTIVGSVPTSVSSSSSSVVHSHAVSHTPIVAQVPVAYHAAPVAYHAAPVVHSVGVPAAYSAHGLINTHGLVQTYGAVAPPLAYHGVHGGLVY